MLIFFLVSLLASVVGAICGIGGGVIIKPVLDLLHLESVSTISFLSVCTVLSMSCYSVGRTMLAGERRVSLATGTPLAIGAAVGGLLGSQLFAAVKAMFANPNAVGSIQAVCLALMTAGTLLYTVNKARIPTHRVRAKAACAVIGLALGIVVAVVMAVLGNLVVTPAWLGVPVDAVVAMIVPILIPFNLLKGILNSVLTLIVYKAISNLITPKKDQVKGL